MSGSVPPELTRPIPVERVGAGGLCVAVSADPAECAAIARRLMIPSVDVLRCEWHLRPGPGGGIDAEGSLRARVQQLCVITLDPFAVEIVEEFSVRFVPPGSESDGDDPAEPDEIPWRGGAIDLGDAAVEQLALALDPYPRKPGAELPATDANEAQTALGALAKLLPPR